MFSSTLGDIEETADPDDRVDDVGQPAAAADLPRHRALAVLIAALIFAGLLDGRLRSLLIAAAWAVGGYFSLGLPGALDPPAYIGWPLVIATAALAITGAIAFFLALFMCAGAYFLDGEPLPEGEASTGLQARLTGNDWVWPFVALAFLVGGILQIAAA